MKTTILFILLTTIMFLAVGCGPGQPFEIEPTHTPPKAVPTVQLASAADCP